MLDPSLDTFSTLLPTRSCLSGPPGSALLLSLGLLHLVTSLPQLDCALPVGGAGPCSAARGVARSPCHSMKTEQPGEEDTLP